MNIGHFLILALLSSQGNVSYGRATLVSQGHSCSYSRFVQLYLLCTRRSVFFLPLVHEECKLTLRIAITTTPNGGNHTPAFTKAAKTMEAHNAMILTAKGLALTGLRALTDRIFLSDVRSFSFLRRIC